MLLKRIAKTDQNTKKYDSCLTGVIFFGITEKEEVCNFILSNKPSNWRQYTMFKQDLCWKVFFIQYKISVTHEKCEWQFPHLGMI